MNACDICGKVSAEVGFDSGRGKHLCISCKFGSGEFHTKKIRKQTEQEKAQQQVQQARERAYMQQTVQDRQAERKKTEIPVLISLDVRVGGATSQVFYPATIQNFSPGGICIDWRHCQECSGYTEGGVHPFCIFSMFSIHNPDAKELTIRIDIANQGVNLEFKGQVVYTQKKGDKEYLGITFTQIQPDTIKFLEQLAGQ